MACASHILAAFRYLLDLRQITLFHKKYHQVCTYMLHTSLRKFFYISLVLGSLLIISGCGQTGPLYLPDETKTKEAA